MKYTVFDIETNGLLKVLQRLHVFSWRTFERGKLIDKGSTNNPEVINKIVKEAEFLVGHNIVRFDIPALKILYGIEIPWQKLIDTLGLSWALYPFEFNSKKQVVTRKNHGLEAWGEHYGVPKPKVVDWETLTYEEYKYRCEEDVKINSKLFSSMMRYLLRIYNNCFESIFRYCKYLSFKLDCAREQEEIGCKISIPRAHQHLERLLFEIEEKMQSLASAMPEIPKYTTRKKPKIMYKQDGSLSALGEKWLELLKEQNLPLETEEISVLKGYDEANPASHIQLKNWLFSLGWEPTIYVDRVNTKGVVNAVPQITDDEGNICPNLKLLSKDYPEIELLEGLGILNHRKGVFNGFIASADENEMIVASVNGFTNTLRFKHRKPIANLPKVSKPWGKEIRGLIEAYDDNHIMCGSDMSSLEDTTKQHYMYFFDPNYVTQMRVPGFDPHMDIAVFAGLLTEEQVTDYKRIKKLLDGDGEVTQDEKKLYMFYTDTRGNAKVINFSAVYGAGPPKIASTLGCSLEFAKLLHTAYWSRNKAVKQVANSVTTIAVQVPDADILNVPETQLWLYNPVSKFYYTLRNEKDIFSTLNQGTGVYCFDTWVSKVRKKGIKITLQYHDEIGLNLLKEDKDKVKKSLQDSIKETDDLIKLNVPLGISVDFGNTYADVH